MREPWRVLPEKFIERVKTMYPGSYQDVLESFSAVRPTTFRVNTLKTTADCLEQSLAKQGFTIEKVAWWENAFILRNQSQRALTDTPEYKEGLLYVQSLSSMIPALVLDPKPGEKILDIAAAPGSKTTQIGALMNNTGEIIANDNSRIRLYRLEANLKMQGVANTRVVYGPGQLLWQQYPEYFDKTLVDVPCSMEGRFDCADPKSYEHWSTKKIKELVERQRFLLRSAISATKPGGSIVYATCTLSPEENEGIIDWILRREAGALTTEQVVVPHMSFDQAILAWKTKNYHTDCARTARIHATSVMEGFYIAKFRKVAYSPSVGVGVGVASNAE